MATPDTLKKRDFGEAVVFDCLVQAGLPTPQLSWFFNGHYINNTVSSRLAVSILLIMNLSN